MTVGSASRPPAHDRPGDIARGIGVGLAWPVFLVLLLLASSFTAPETNVVTKMWFSLLLPGVFFIGATQAFVVVPVSWWAWKHGRRRLLYAVLSVAGVIVLLNGACWASLGPLIR